MLTCILMTNSSSFSLKKNQIAESLIMGPCHLIRHQNAQACVRSKSNCLFSLFHKDHVRQVNKMNALPFCPANSDNDPLVALRSGLSESAIRFLDKLIGEGLAPIHPLCNGANATFPNITSDGLPPPPTELDPKTATAVGFENTFSTIITLYYQIAPALLAMTELWVRLFAFSVAPLSVLYLLVDEVLYQICGTKEGKWRHWFALTSTTLGLASAAVLLTDSLYVHEYGRALGATYLILLTALSARTIVRRKMSRWIVFVVLAINGITGLCLIRSGGGPTIFDHPGLDLPKVQEGLYHSHRNEFISEIVKNWPTTYRTYAVENGATHWLKTGDSRTGIPFLLNSAPSVDYRRVWAWNEDDGGEHIALDIAFPPDHVHRTDKPLYIILHGLNGGSSEEYVREFVFRRTAEGSTCVVMIARGLMDTPVASWNVFHGARVSDIHAASGYIRRAMASDDQILAGVGFSMGAIVLANYVARSGNDCNLHAAMAVSGGLDMREQINFFRSMRLWQPMLAKELRDTFIIGKFEARYRERLSDEDYLELMRSAHISEIDRHGVVTYNGFDDLMHYYSEMSAMGDHDICIDRRSDGEGDVCPATSDYTDRIGRLANIKIPMVALHALDDPLVTYRSVANVDPAVMVNSGEGNLMLLLTKSGGHVGWPLGTNPAERGWEWMNNAARDFVLAVDKARKASQNQKSGK